MRAWLSVVAVILILAVVLVVRQRDPVKRARILKRVGFGVMAVVTAFFGLFVVGETFTDPGGWTALGLVAAWALPLMILAAVAWYRPDRAVRLFAVLIAAVIGVSVWFAMDPEGWRAFEDRHGPIRAIISFVLAAAVALLGLKRTAVAGVLLLVLGVVPVVVSSLGSPLGFASLAVVSSAPFIAGILYLWSAALAGRSVLEVPQEHQRHHLSHKTTTGPPIPPRRRRHPAGGLTPRGATPISARNASTPGCGPPPPAPATAPTTIPSPGSSHTLNRPGFIGGLVA